MKIATLWSILHLIKEFESDSEGELDDFNIKADDALILAAKIVISIV